MSLYWSERIRDFRCEKNTNISAQMEESPSEDKDGPKRKSVSTRRPRVDHCGFHDAMALSTGSWMKRPMSLIKQKQLEGGWPFKTKGI